MKENDATVYVHRKSNHPPTILNSIPTGVNRRLSKISSTKEIFESAVPKYQEALNKSGYNHILQYEPPEKQKAKKKNRKRPVTWFNPPFSLNVKTNVGKEFLNLIDKSFPPDNPLSKLFNRHTVKLGYKCMPNMAKSIARHNSKILSEGTQTLQPAGCNCEGGAACCPIQGGCKQAGVVYRASVKENQSGITNTYTGLTGRAFKDRWKEHQNDFEKPKNRTQTMLSSHIWELKDKGVDFTISWKILDRGPTFNPVSKKCILCLKEKYFIMYHAENSTLNKRNEVFNTCRHRRQSLLEKVK